MPYYFAANVKGMMEKTRTIVSNVKGQLYMSWDKTKNPDTKTGVATNQNHIKFL